LTPGHLASTTSGYSHDGCLIATFLLFPLFTVAAAIMATCIAHATVTTPVVDGCMMLFIF